MFCGCAHSWESSAADLTQPGRQSYEDKLIRPLIPIASRRSPIPKRLAKLAGTGAVKNVHT